MSGSLTAVAAFHYPRVIVYMRDAEADPAPIERYPFGSVALALSVAGVVLLALFPEPILGFVRSSAGSLF